MNEIATRDIAIQVCAASERHTSGRGRHDAAKWGPCSIHEQVTAEVWRHVNAEIERAAEALDDLALVLVTTSEDNPEGNTLTASVVTKCAEIVRQFKDRGGRS